MYDVNDRSHGRTDGNVNGATKGKRAGRGVDENEGGPWVACSPVGVSRSSHTVRWPIDGEDVSGHSRAAPLRGIDRAPNADHRFGPLHVVHIEHGPHVAGPRVPSRARPFT